METTSDNTGHRQRLRQRYKQGGINGFHDYEIVELILTYAIPRQDVKPLAKRLLKEFNDLSGVFNSPLESLTSIPGIGENTAILLGLIKDSATAILGAGIKNRDCLKSWNDVVRYCRLRIGGRCEEVFEIICLTAAKEIIEVVTISEGTSNEVAVLPRKVLEAAIKHNASAIVLVHNHPSGDPTPSDPDLILTKKIQKAADIMKITIHDHLILGKDSYFSFDKNRLVKNP